MKSIQQKLDPRMVAHLARVEQAKAEGIGPGMHKVLAGGRVLYCNPRGSWIEVSPQEWASHIQRQGEANGE